MFSFGKRRRAAASDRARNATRFRPQLQALEDRVVPANVLADYAVTQDWNSGFQAQLQLTNQQSTAIEDWTIEFDFAANISSLWDAQIVSHVGDHYVIRGAHWNADLPAGNQVSFGFVAGPDASAEPTNLLINGEPLDSGENPPPVVPTLTIGDVTVDETAGVANFTLQLSQAAVHDVTATFATVDASASADSDYVAASGSVTFAPGQTIQTISISLIDDNIAEADETFRLRLTNIAGAEPSELFAVATIADDDVAPPPQSDDVVFSIESDWGSGFTGQLTITNSESTPLNDWSLEFDFTGTISSIWNADIVSHVGDHYVIQPAEWNGTIASGASISLGFVASPGNGQAVPTNFILHGDVAPSPDPNPDPPAPDPEPVSIQANDDHWRLIKDQTAAINVLGNDTLPNSSITVGVDSPQYGQATVNPDGTISYTPPAGFVGGDTLAYTITDAEGNAATATVHITISETASVWPESVFAPYVDMLLYPTYDLVSAARDHGVQFFSLAFITASSQGQAAWGGFDVYTVNGGDPFEANVKSQIRELRNMGGDVMMSFGGANGQELAEVIDDVAALQAEYQKVIDAYQLTRVDFDIEGAALLHQDAIDRRSQAIAGLQRDAAAAGRELYVSFTLPVLPTGLTPGGIYLLESALHYGVRIDEVNIMAMDYGDAAAPNPDGQMGEYAIQAAESLFQQMRTVYDNAGIAVTDEQLWGAIAVTPMIGLNDVTTETFYLQDAKELLAFAKDNGLARIAMWSLNRDRYQDGVTYVSPTSSSIMQDPFAFASVFVGLMED